MRFLSGAPRHGTGHHTWVARYHMDAGQAFGPHRHDPAQVAWAPDGVLTATVDGTAFVLTPAQALWIPSGAEHDVAARTDVEAHFVYIDPDERTLGWTAPTAVTATPLVRELFAHLAGEVDPVERRHAEALLLRLMRPGPATAVPVRLPVDPRAREVAVALVDDPADDRTLEEWGRAVGASSRTLARAFAADTSLTFSAWRAQARLGAALELLAAGQAPAQVATRVGYTSPRAFAAAFRRAFGTSPQRYLATHRAA